MNWFKKTWEELEAGDPRPTRFRAVVMTPFDVFRAKVMRADHGFARELATSLYQGDVWILTGAFPQAFMESLKDKTAAFMRSQPCSFHKMLEGSPDFHRVIDLEAGRKYAFAQCKHAAYFYRWNDDPLGVWAPVTKRWRIVKAAMGLRPDEYESNTPKAGVVDRVQVVRYPPAIGHLEPHGDPYLHQRLFFSGYMSRRNIDYLGGGFYMVDRKDRVVELEDQFRVGDACIGYATVCHGVAPVDRHKKPDWAAADGRWFLSMYSNASDEVKKRHTGRPAKLALPGVLPVDEAIPA